MSLVQVPAFYDMKWVKEDGTLTPDAFLFLDEAFKTLAQGMILLNLISNGRIINNDPTINDGTVVNDALVAPSKTTVEITALGADTSIALGSIFFDTDISKLKVKTAASTIETITSS